MNGEIQGDFFELTVGNNVMKVTASENVEIEVEYEPRYIHSVNAEDMRLD